jgi:hypothetical protein
METNRPFQFQHRSQPFLGVHNETLFVIAVLHQQSRLFARWNQSLSDRGADSPVRAEIEDTLGTEALACGALLVEGEFFYHPELKKGRCRDCQEVEMARREGPQSPGLPSVSACSANPPSTSSLLDEGGHRGAVPQCHSGRPLHERSRDRERGRSCDSGGHPD